MSLGLDMRITVFIWQVINTGMKVIARAEADNVGCNFRLMQEVGKNIIAEYAFVQYFSRKI